MEIKNKINVKFLIVMFLSILMLASGKVYARKTYPSNPKNYHINQSGINISINDYKEYDNIFCMESGTYINDKNNPDLKTNYTVIEKIHINGDNAISEKNHKKSKRKENLVMNKILSYWNDPEYNGTGTWPKKQGPVQRALWKYAEIWDKKAREDKLISQQFCKILPKHKTADVPLLDKKILEEDPDVVNYREYKDYTENSKITNLRFGQKINVFPVKFEEEYTAIGPFRIDFRGEINSLVIKDQNKNIIDKRNIKIFKYDGSNKIQEIEKLLDIKSGKTFYIALKDSATENVTEISKIEVKNQFDVNKVDLILLAPAGNLQNLIIVNPYEGFGTDDINLGKVPLKGKIKIIKCDEDAYNNHTIKGLKDVIFRLKKSGTNVYVQAEYNQSKKSYIVNGYTTDKSKATELRTDENGKILIENLAIGEYTAEEIQNPHKQYGDIIAENGGAIKNFEIKTNSDGTPTYIKNKQKYIDLSGYVWVDVPNGKGTKRNELYQENSGDNLDYLIKNQINVYLKDVSGKTVNKMTTVNGKYRFENVNIDDVRAENLYIEFEYNGLIFRSINVNERTDRNSYIKKGNSSKAQEPQDIRKIFNNSYNIVTSKGNDRETLLGNNTIIRYKGTHEGMNEYEEGVEYENAIPLITANTKATGYKITIAANDYGVASIDNINLGLIKRMQPQLGIWHDLESVNVSINNKRYTYHYGERNKHIHDVNDQIKKDIEEKGSSDPLISYTKPYSNISYERNLYESDIKQEFTDQNRKLKVDVIYKITPFNEPSLRPKITSIVDYYDPNYEIESIGEKLNERENKVINSEKLLRKDTPLDKYKKVTVAAKEGDTIENLYIQFNVNPDVFNNKLKNENDKYLLNNVAEINSYKVFDNDNNPYAGVDTISVPGSATPRFDSLQSEDERKRAQATYESDTDSAPAFTLVRKGTRTIEGQVFLDKSEITQAGTRQGNGILDDGETKINGVDVILKEKSGSGKEYSKKTTGNGDFKIEGFIPGDYELEFKWGDEGYKVQDYKATIFKDKGEGNNKWYITDEQRFSDAMDDYGMRQAIDKEYNENPLKYDHKDKAYEEKWMISRTPNLMNLGVEKTINDKETFTNVPKYEVNNVDFGIVERAKQNIELEKRVKDLKLTVGRDKVKISDVEIEPNGNLKGNKDNITYLRPQNKKGQIKGELDNELLEGTVVEITYEVKAINRSETDYLDQDFYEFGKIPAAIEREGKLVKIKPTKVIDYLDEDLSFDKEKNKVGADYTWETQTIETLRDNHLIDETLLDNAVLKSYNILTTDALKDKTLKPSDEASVDLYVTKEISGSKDIELDNEAEIIEVIKNGGGILITIPGNYEPGKNGENQEKDGDIAEKILIIPSTGGNKNATIAIAITISLVVIAGGIILIKKKVLNKKN